MSNLDKELPQDRQPAIEEPRREAINLDPEFTNSDVSAGLAAAFGKSPTPEVERLRARSLYGPGSMIADKYQLIEQIGEGGMGFVWYAEQFTPVKRKVAIKLIKPGLDSQSVLSRFEAERQALALMDHPNIARVFDGGITDFGHPFFAMELVRGTSITTWCDQNKTCLRERLELLIPVCQAIHHAHQKGVIHRDIKPSNIMVAMFDGKPVPKVIDFGVAKAFGATLTEVSLHTAFGAVVGTAEYMSPEQAELNNLDIDTRSDVYSLGVLMYELLAGSTPFPRVELAEHGLREALRVIRDVDPPLPSARLSTSKMRASIAALRGIEPNELGKLLRSELDWVVMKTLEKERGRRYESASALALDLQRYLQDEPVEACPPSAAYRIRKFTRRHRWPVLTSLLLLATMVAGIIGTSWGLFRAEFNRNIAVEAMKAADDRAAGERLAKLEAQRQQKLAEDAEDATLESFRASTDDAIEKLIGSKSALSPQSRNYLENAKRRWQVFADREGDTERSRAIRGEGLFRLGIIWEYLGQSADAQSALEQSASIWDLLSLESPFRLNYRNSCCVARHRLARVLQKLGDFSKAELEMRKALESGEKLIADSPNETLYVANLGKYRNTLGSLLKRLGRLEAADQYREGLRIFERLAADFPSVIEYRFQIARLESNLGNFLAEKGHTTEAEELLRKAVKSSASLAADLRFDPSYQSDLAERLVSLGRFLRARLAKPVEGIHQLSLGLEIYERIANEFPSVPYYQRELGDGCNDLAQILTMQGRFEEAQTQLNKAVKTNEKLMNDFPEVAYHQVSLGCSYRRMGELAIAQGDTAESLNWFNKAVGLTRVVYEAKGSDEFSRSAMEECLLGLANGRAKLNQDTPADWQAVRQMIPKDGPPLSRIKRAVLLLRAESIEESVSEMDTLINETLDDSRAARWGSVEWYDAACFFSVASSKAPDRQREFAGRSIELLKRAKELGFTDIEYISRDPDLAPLREQSDFSELIQSFQRAVRKTTDQKNE